MTGTTVGNYRIVSHLGSGGMGVVYKALDTRLHRHVALKVLPADVSNDPVRRQRFLQEARAASALNDPHIITIHDVFEHEGTDVLVMELVEGRTLRDAMDGPLPVEQAVTWARQMADALGLAHGAGIVHRDLKPSNVMVTERGSLKVLDFGLAKVAPMANEVTVAAATVAGDVLGTIEYMSPEQARGEPVDHRTDIYSLGTMLYEMLAGRRPFVSGNRLALLNEVAHGTPKSLRELNPAIPEALSDVAMKALARDPRLRFQSMWELSSALKFLPASGSHVSDDALSPAPGVPTRRTPRAAIAAGGVLLLIGAGAGFRAWRTSETSVQPQTAAQPATALSAPSTTALEFTQQGLALLRRFDRTGNVTKAIASFDAAITVDKGFAPAWAGLARAFWRQKVETGDAVWATRAVDAARQAVGLDAYLADGHVSLGFATLSAGNVPAARQSLERALLLDPSNAGAHRGLGDLEQAADRLAEARDHYERAMASDPTDWELARLRSAVSFDAADYADSLAWAKRSADAAPDSASPYLMMGAASHGMGDYAGAAAAFQKSIGIQPTASAYTNLGTALFFEGLYRDSLQAFERAVELEPSRAILWGNLADAYRWVPGNTAKSSDAYGRAIQIAREVLAKDSENLTNRSRLALYLAKSGDITGSLVELAKVPRDAAEVNVLFRGAVTYELAGDRANALAMLELALDRGYSLTEVRMDPELATLRTDARYHRLIARFERPAPLR